jgi:hypothetical protein
MLKYLKFKKRFNKNLKVFFLPLVVFPCMDGTVGDWIDEDFLMFFFFLLCPPTQVRNPTGLPRSCRISSSRTRRSSLQRASNRVYFYGCFTLIKFTVFKFFCNFRISYPSILPFNFQFPKKSTLKRS